MNNQESPENNQPQPATQAENDSTQEMALQACQSQVQELSQKVLRLTADFDNYKRRVDKDRLSWMASAQKIILLDILPIVDDFERALANAGASESQSGIAIIAKNLGKMLEKSSVKVMDIKPGTLFDPEKHEAVTQMQSDQYPSGAIVEVFENGYFFKDEVLRPAKVSVVP